jgi:hypothetical protein
MTFVDLQKIFNRAFWLSFSKQKLLFTFFVLVACGLLAVFCRGLGEISGNSWISMSLAFLPIFLSTLILLFASVLLIRVYHDEVKNKQVSFIGVFKKSFDVMLTASSFGLPLVLIYLLLFIVLGIFFLLKEIPSLGDALSIILAFAPFLLILGLVILTFGCFFLLFFASPMIALKADEKFETLKSVTKRLKQNILGNFLLFCLSLVPLAFIVLLLLIAVYLTNINYLPSSKTGFVVLEWFFIMVPFALVLSPAVVFFFNFSAESFVFFRKQETSILKV